MERILQKKCKNCKKLRKQIRGLKRELEILSDTKLVKTLTKSLKDINKGKFLTRKEAGI